MTDAFAFKWAYGCLAALLLFCAAGLFFRSPLPPSTFICLIIGAVYGAVTIGPIVYVALRRL